MKEPLPTADPMLDPKVVPVSSDPNALPKGHDYFDLRRGLANCRLKFEHAKRGRVAFLGGSITQSSGWRELVMDYLQNKFPETQFQFIGAGIGSLGSVPHAFRLERDVLSRGTVDLLFVEAAVNDSTNIPEHPGQMLRGMEGVVRHARLANPLADIIQMHFVMPEHMADYNNGKTPVAIAQHEKVASAYGNPSLNLAREVTDRINAGEFSWERDFIDLHPSPFGHQLYAGSIARMLDAAFEGPADNAPKPHPLPVPLDKKSYFRGRLGNIAGARIHHGFTLEDAWHPIDGRTTRPGFVDVPSLVASEPGAEFEFAFEGTVAGLFITSGPDAGQIEFSIDRACWQTVETFTRWSSELHLPWAVLLDDERHPGLHTAHVRIAAAHHANSIGTALRVFHFLSN